MRSRTRLFATGMLIVLAFIASGCSDRVRDAKPKKMRTIVTSDSIMSTMAASLMPLQLYSVTAILPPGQCPGHYDVKLSDVEQIKKADLIISFKGIPFLDKAIGEDRSRHLIIDTEGRNWMTPDSYLYGLDRLADKLAEHFPEDRDTIMARKKDVAHKIKVYADSLVRRIDEAGLSGKPVIAASMQKAPLEWMGFRVVGDYGRPEAMSAREITRLLRTGKERHAVFVVDNLQSGPDTGKGIAESLGIPHVILTNFPSEEGYLETLRKNVETILTEAKMKRNDSAAKVVP